MVGLSGGGQFQALALLQGPACMSPTTHTRTHTHTHNPVTGKGQVDHLWCPSDDSILDLPLPRSGDRGTRSQPHTVR